MIIKNMVPCKMCSKNFEYSPGFSGNARQFCDNCMETVDEAELVRIEEEMVTEKNRYLMGATKRKSEYDPISILMNREMPKLDSDADKFVCTMEMATFVKDVGINGLEKGIADLFDIISPAHRVLFIQHQTLQTLEKMCQHPNIKRHTKVSMKIASEK